MNNNKKPLISVIIPVYKVEKYLDKCVQSVVDQTYKNLQIILVDDGSPDNCPKMCDSWAKKDKRIEVYHKPNGGVSSARNLGINKAKGKHIVFLDSDDSVDKTTYEKYLSKLDNTCDTVFCKIKRFLTDGSIVDDNEINLIELEKNKNNIIPFYYRDNSFQKNNNVTTFVNRCLYNSKVIKDNHLLFNKKLKFQEDKIFLLKYLSLCKGVKVIDEHLFLYCHRKDSMLNNLTVYKGFAENFKIVFDEEFKIIENNPYISKKMLKTLKSKACMEYVITIMYRYVYGNAPKEDYKKLYKNPNFKFLLKNGHFIFDDKFITFKKVIFFYLAKFKLINVIKTRLKKR